MGFSPGMVTQHVQIAPVRTLFRPPVAMGGVQRATDRCGGRVRRQVILTESSCLANSEASTSSSRSIAGDLLHGMPPQLSIAHGAGSSTRYLFPTSSFLALRFRAILLSFCNVHSKSVSEGSFMH